MYQHALLPIPSRIRFPQAAPRRGLKLLCLLAICLAGTWFGSVTTSLGQVSVTPTIGFDINTGIYTYSYSVTNGTVDTLAIVSFGAMPTGTLTVQNLTAPMGFISTYDSGNGFISFLEDNNASTPQTFEPGSTITPFTFTSTVAPGATTFEALDINGNSFTGITQAPIPEPGILALCALAVPAAGFLLYRRRKLQRSICLA